MMLFLELLIALFVLSIAWSAWKKTMRDQMRDVLFDLRDEWRDFWISTGRSMDDQIYVRMRRDINAYLRYTKRLRFVGLLYIVVAVDKRAIARIATEQENFLLTRNKNVANKIHSMRHRSVRAVQTYMLSTTLLIIPLVFAGVAAFMAYGLSRPVVAFRKAAAKIVDGITLTQPKTIQVAVLA